MITTQLVRFGGTPITVAFQSDLIDASAGAGWRAEFDAACPVAFHVEGHKITHLLSDSMQDKLAELAEAVYLTEKEEAHTDSRIDNAKYA